MKIRYLILPRVRRKQIRQRMHYLVRRPLKERILNRFRTSAKRITRAVAVCIAIAAAVFFIFTNWPEW